MKHGERKINNILKGIKKEYILNKINEVEKIIDNSGINHTLRGYKYKHFGFKKAIKNFNKDALYNYLEDIISYAYTLNLLDETFTY